MHLLWINPDYGLLPGAGARYAEDGEADIMKRPPRNADDGIFADGLGFDVAFQGIVITVLTLASHFIGHYLEAGRWEIVNSPDGMSMAFLTLSMVEIFPFLQYEITERFLFSPYEASEQVSVGRDGTPHLSSTSAVIYIPVLSSAFRF